MTMRYLAALVSAPLLLGSWLTAAAQDEEDEPPYVTPVDTYTCYYNDGKGPADLDKATADWNAWMDEQGAGDYGAYIITPVYYGKDTFEVGWLGYWTSQEAMGAGIDGYMADGSKVQAGFDKVLTCDSHEHWATIQLKDPPGDTPPDNVVLMFTNCVKSDETDWDTLFDAIGKATDYMTEHGFKNGAWAMWPVFGGGGEPEWDFKWVTSYANYTDFGKAYQHNANGGGRQAMNEIMDDMLDCDPGRVYNAKTVRRVTPPTDE